MLSSVYVLTSTGSVLCEKHWRGLLPRSLVDQFWTEVAACDSPEDVVPVIAVNSGSTGRVFLHHVLRNGMFFVAIVQKEVSPLAIIEFLHRIADVLKAHFDGVLAESILRENFVTVYELLEEMGDHGFPFTTEPNALQEIIPPPGLATIMSQVTGKGAMRDKIGQGALSNTPWRRAGCKYTANEIYLDVIETIDCTLEPNGQPVYAEAVGEVQVSCKLSGMPDLTLSFLNSQVVDDVSFHPCVRLARWEQGRNVSFVPPDGLFKLMDYRVKGQIDIPLNVQPQILFTEGSGKVNVRITSRPGKNVENIVITIPFPKTTQTPALSPNCGSISYNDKLKELKWFVGTMPSDRTPQLEGTITMKADAPVPESNPVLAVDFKVASSLPSGLKVDSLQLYGEQYKPYKGVRLVTKGGKFHVRA